MKWTDKIETMFRRKRYGEVFEKEINEIKESNISSFPIDFNIRMLVISDGHGCLDYADIPDCDVDVCLLLGDLSKEDIIIIKEKVVDVPIYGVLGNHDGFELYDRHGIENIHGKVVEVNGVKIAGMGGSLRYKYSDMPLYTDEESFEIAESMDRADILISHDSPKFMHGDRDFAHSGLQGITHYCEKWNEPLNIHGHHHENFSKVLENGTRSVGCFGVQIVDTRKL